MVVVGIVVLVAPAQGARGTRSYTDWLLLYGTFLFAVLIMASFFHFMALLQYRGNPQLRKPMCLSYNDRAFRFTTAHSETRQDWEGIERWQETPNLLLLQLSRQQRYVVPKRAFSSAEQLAAFLRLLALKQAHSVNFLRATRLSRMEARVEHC
jgi:hypothetical protein